MDTVIEVKIRSGRIVTRQRFTGESVRIGRAYDNDLVLSDMYISPHHVQLKTQGDGTWALEDRGSVNGVSDTRQRPLKTGHIIKSGDEIVLGKLTVRVLAVDHPVPLALRIHRAEQYVNSYGKPQFAFAALCLFAALNVFFTYLETDAKFSFKTGYSSTLWGLLVIVMWAGLWSVLGRFIKLEPRFFAHILIATIFLVCVGLYAEAVSLFIYNFGGQKLFDMLLYAGLGVLFVGLFWLSFYLALAWRRRNRNIIAVVLSATLMFSVYFINSDSQEFHPTPRYNSVLKAPRWLYATPVSREEYLRDGLKIFADSVKLAREEKEEEEEEEEEKE